MGGRDRRRPGLAEVLERGGDYLFALKANRPAMLKAVAAFFADPPEPLDSFETMFRKSETRAP